MPKPFAFRDWDYKGKPVRTVVDDVGGVHFVEGDIHRIMESDAPFRKPPVLDGHQSRPLSGDRRQESLVSESRIKALLRESRGPEARPLPNWLESEVMPALHGPGRRGQGPQANDPILSGLNALIGLRAGQLSLDRHFTALAEAVGPNKDAALTLSSPAAKASMSDLIAWCQTQGVDLAARTGTRPASPAEEDMSSLFGEALKISSSRMSMRQPGVADGTSVEGRDEDGVPSHQARKTAGRTPAPVHDEVIEIDPRALAEARKAAALALGDDEDNPVVFLKSSLRPPAKIEDQFEALLALTLSKDSRKD
jgi:hypothetical protein